MQSFKQNSCFENEDLRAKKWDMCTSMGGGNICLINVGCQYWDQLLGTGSWFPGVVPVANVHVLSFLKLWWCIDNVRSVVNVVDFRVLCAQYSIGEKSHKLGQLGGGVNFMSQSLHNTKVLGVGDMPHSKFFFPKIFTKSLH